MLNVRCDDVPCDVHLSSTCKFVFIVFLFRNGPHLEYNQDSMRQQLCDWCSSVGERSAVFDFTTKAQLQEAIKSCQYDRLQDSQGHPPGVIGWWPLMAVTFIDNHDTGSTQQHWPFPGGPAILQGYAVGFQMYALLYISFCLQNYKFIYSQNVPETYSSSFLPQIFMFFAVYYDSSGHSLHILGALC